MVKALKVRVYPTKAQEELLQKTFGCTRYIYNHFLGRCISVYKESNETLTNNMCSKELTQLKKELVESGNVLIAIPYMIEILMQV